MSAPVPETPETASAWRRAVGSVAIDVGLLRRRRDFGLLVAGQTISEPGSMAAPRSSACSTPRPRSGRSW